MFKASQVVDRDVSKIRELLAAQPRCPTSPTNRQTHGPGRHPVAPATHRLPELRMLHWSSLTQRGRLVLALTVLRQADDWLIVRAKSNVDA